MTHDDFDKLVDYIVDERIKKIMCQKSTEYARGEDKLYNFKHAARVSGKTPLECLQGMKLKHDVSILDMLDDEAVEGSQQHTREKWEEKIGDDINYLILMLALLYEKHGWKIPGTETKPENVEGLCTSCLHLDVAGCDTPCNVCISADGHLNWKPKP